MSRGKYYSYIVITFVTVVLLSVLWEFWLETPVLGLFIEDIEPEPLTERWEYIVTIALFVSLALIYPAIMGGKLVSKQNEQYGEIKRISEHDYLTGIYNRRTINEVLVKEIKRSDRYGFTFAVILLDIDSFKKTNDEFGHTAGDHLLVEMSEVMRNTTRASDTIGRWGGEEFLVVCPQTDRDGVFLLAEKLRKNIDDRKFSVVGDKTVSVGVAEYHAGDNAESIVARADKALYTAKQQGKNRIVRAA